MEYCFFKWRLKREQGKKANSGGCSGKKCVQVSRTVLPFLRYYLQKPSSMSRNWEGEDSLDHQRGFKVNNRPLKPVFDCLLQKYVASAGESFGWTLSGIKGNPWGDSALPECWNPSLPSCQALSPTQWGSLMTRGISFHGVGDTNSLRD